MGLIFGAFPDQRGGQNGRTTMFKLLSHCLIPLMFWGLAVSDKNEEENYLLELTDETFEEAVATPDFMIVEFYASW